MLTAAKKHKYCRFVNSKLVWKSFLYLKEKSWTGFLRSIAADRYTQ